MKKYIVSYEFYSPNGPKTIICEASTLKDAEEIATDIKAENYYDNIQVNERWFRKKYICRFIWKGLNCLSPFLCMNYIVLSSDNELQKRVVLSLLLEG